MSPRQHNPPLLQDKMKQGRKTGQTRTVRRTVPRRREDGRPAGTLKRFPFDETRLGFMLRYEMPIVYYLLRRLCPGQQPFEPDWRVVDSVAGASKDPSYRNPSSAATWRSTAGTDSIAGGESGSHPGAKPITRVSVAARRKTLSGGTASGSGRSTGNCRMAGNCCRI